MQVVDHQPDAILERVQILQQPFHDLPTVQTGRRRQLPHERRPGRRIAQRVQYREPEPLHIALLGRHRDPGGAIDQPRLANPRTQQERLPAPSRRRHLHHPTRSLEPLEQRTTRDDHWSARRSNRNGSGPGLRHEATNLRTPAVSERRESPDTGDAGSSRRERDFAAARWTRRRHGRGLLPAKPAATRLR